MRLTSAEVQRAAIVPVWLGAFYTAVNALLFYSAPDRGFGMDARAFWLTGAGGPLYQRQPLQLDAYLYSPAFAQLIHPLTLLPWPLFLGVWAATETLLFLWLALPLGWKWAVPLVLYCVPEIAIGNVYGLLAVSLVAALKAPAAWAFPTLTKITPGAGSLWFALQGNWRRFLLASGATFSIAVGSYALDHNAWEDWFRFLSGTARSVGPSLWWRLTASLMLIAIGARLNRAWLLAPATILAMPVTQGNAWLTLLMAIPRLQRTDSPFAGDLGEGHSTHEAIPGLGERPSGRQQD